jgi:ABC-type transport system involved in multi-copper enzyme maturation permease subunit
MATSSEYHVEYDRNPIRSRISWGAILAGAAVAMAIYTLLMALGVAVGMSVSDDVNVRTLGTGAGVWGFISLLVALFAGGWVTTQVTTGESRTEAVLYGVVLWATTSVLLFWLTTHGVQAGVQAALATQNTAAADGGTYPVNTDRGRSDQQNDMERARNVGKETSWWAFAGLLLSMVAAVGGAMVGPVELTVRRDTRHYRTPTTPTT